MIKKTIKMLDRDQVKLGTNYLFKGVEVTVFMIHTLGRGNSITLCNKLPAGCDNPYPYLLKGTVRMMDFRRQAEMLVNK